MKTTTIKIQKREEANKQNIAVLDELVAPDFFHPTWQLRGPEGMKQFYTMFLKGFPDCHETIEDIIAEGDNVWARITYTGDTYWRISWICPHW